MANEQGVSHICNHLAIQLDELLCFVVSPSRVVRVYLLRCFFEEGDNPIFNA